MTITELKREIDELPDNMKIMINIGDSTNLVESDCISYDDKDTNELIIYVKA